SLITDISDGGGRFGAILGLGLLAAYLWWRGLALTLQPLYRERIYSRFLVGLGVLILAIMAAATIGGAPRSMVVAALALLLPAEVFAGLVGIALAHVADTEREHRERRPLAIGDDEAGATINRAWITTALGISGLVVAAALVLTLVVSYESLRTLAALLRPAGEGLRQLIEWLVTAFAFLLFLLLNGPITFLHNLIARSQTGKPPSSSATTTLPNKPPLPFHAPPEWFFAGRLALVALVALVAVFILLRLLRQFASLREEQGFEEEREALNAGAVLGQQFRGLFARRPAAPAPLAEEALRPGTVRYLYRELLRAGARAGHPRRLSETPDEYARRLRDVRPTPAEAGEMPSQGQVDEALAALTETYDPARYGGASDTVAPPAIVSAWRVLMRWLAGGEGASGAAEGRRRIFRRGGPAR
ncbi:MAG: DUF4129 domain-containing protein, partial [Ktedonobacterales bacterium]|nr:DUF4129 domain-containing protein [Ktedonobacterales bacterium]